TVHDVLHLGVDLLLDLRVLEDRLDDQVAAAQRLQLAGGGDAAQQFVPLLGGGPPAGDRLVHQFGRVGLAAFGGLVGDVPDDHVHAGLGAGVGDAGAHHAAAEHRHLGGLPGGDVGRSTASGVDVLQVEEERLAHVLRGLPAQQLDEVAAFDGERGVDVDLGALH